MRWLVILLLIGLSCQNSLPVANEEINGSKAGNCKDSNEEGGVNLEESETLEVVPSDRSKMNQVIPIDVQLLNNVNEIYNIPVGDGWYTCPDSL